MNTLYFSRLSVLLLLLVFLLACGGSKPAASGTAGESLRFDMRHFGRELPGCKEEGARCARITVDYPVAEGGRERTRRFINDTIERHVWKMLAGLAFEADSDNLHPDTITRRFFDLYVTYTDELGEYALQWETETSAKVAYQSPRIVTVSIENFTFVGGAHPNTYTELLNFDLNRLRLLKLKDIISDEERFKGLAEARFREYYELARDANLNEEGFFWDKPFYLPDNFGVEEAGLHLYYNPYEAAPYALGSADFMIPWQDLKGIMRKSFKR